MAKMRYAIQDVGEFQYSKFRVWWIHKGKEFKFKAKDPKNQATLDFIYSVAAQDTFLTIMSEHMFTLYDWYQAFKARNKSMISGSRLCPGKDHKLRNFRFIETLLRYLEYLDQEEAEAQILEEDSYAMECNQQEVITEDLYPMGKMQIGLLGYTIEANIMSQI